VPSLEAAHAWREKMREAKRLGLIDRIPGRHRDPNFVRTPRGVRAKITPGRTRIDIARDYLTEMEQKEAAGTLIAFDEKGDELPAPLTYGQRLEQLTGLALRTARETLEMPIDMEKPDPQLLRIKNDMARSIISAQVKIDQSAFKAQQAGQIIDLLREIADARKKDDDL
jgi:hypothetical protein